MPFIDLSALVSGGKNKKQDDNNDAPADQAQVQNNPQTQAAAPVSIPSEVVVAQQQAAANANQPLAETAPVQAVPAVATPQAVPQVAAPAPVEVTPQTPVQQPQPVAEIPVSAPAPVVEPIPAEAQVAPVPVVPVPAEAVSQVEQTAVAEVPPEMTNEPESEMPVPAESVVTQTPEIPIVEPEQNVQPALETESTEEASQPELPPTPEPIAELVMDSPPENSEASTEVDGQPEPSVSEGEDSPEADKQEVTFTSTPDADDPDPDTVEKAIPKVEVENGLEITTEESGIREVHGPEFDDAGESGADDELTQLDNQNLDQKLAEVNGQMPVEVEPAPPEQVDIQSNSTPVVDSDDTNTGVPTAADGFNSVETPTEQVEAGGEDQPVQAQVEPEVTPQAVVPEITEVPPVDNLVPVAGAAVAATAGAVAVPEQPVLSGNDSVPQTSDMLEVPKEMPAVGETVTQTAADVPTTELLAEKEYTLNDLLQQAIDRGASDLHLTADYRAIIRIDGDLTQTKSHVLTNEDIIEMLRDVVKDREVDLEKLMDLDLAYQMPGSDTRFRVNVFRQRGTISAVFRLIPNKIMTVEELNLPPIVKEFTKFSQGLVLVTGPTGSGKSTSIAAMLNDINLEEPKHIVTIEDPIEYVYPVGRALVDQREVFGDTESWANALRSVLRQDPDVVLVGEMRDLETIQAAIRTAETGHLVFATLHTNSAAQSVDRIIDVFPEHQQSQIRTQLASVIQVVLAQRLVPVTGGGRIAAMEIMLANSAVRNAIREDKVYQIDNMIQTNAELGMITMEQSLVNLVREGKISTEKAQEYANKPADILTLLGKV